MTSSGDQLPDLPVYVPRALDRELADIVAAAAGGTSTMVVLVGHSSTGKTRACWEALSGLRASGAEWRLWHPLEPTPPEAVLAGLPRVDPRTVLWLNEVQEYLTDPVLGERVAAGLRALLDDRDRGPVLVLATLWSEHWQRLTTRRDPDVHAQARMLLEGRRLLVPASFTAEDVRALDAHAQHDQRLRQARDHAADGEITQYLAGVPTLLERYEDAPAAAKAVLHAAIDARRLGWGPDLPEAFLADAASGYLSRSEWDRGGDQWFSNAIDYTNQPCGVIPGPLTRTRPRVLPGEPTPTSPPSCRLADSLEQHGRHSRATEYPEESLWAAARVHADASTLITLARAAEDRGLFRIRTQLLATAVRSSAAAATELITSSSGPESVSDDAVWWTAATVPLTEPNSLAGYLWALHAGYHDEALSIVLGRKPSRHVNLTTRQEFAQLANTLHKIGHSHPTRAAAAAELAVIAARKLPDHDDGDPRRNVSRASSFSTDEATPGASHGGRDAPPSTSMDSASSLASQLADLAKAGHDKELVVVLASRPAAHISITNAYGVARLSHRLFTLWYQTPREETGLRKEIKRLAQREDATLILDRRPWEHVDLTDPAGVVVLLEWLYQDLIQWANHPSWLLERLNRNDDPIYHQLRDRPHRDEQHLAWQWQRAVYEAFAMRAAEVSLTDAQGVAILISHLSGEINYDGLEPAGLPAVPAALARLLERNPALHVPPKKSESDWGESAQALITALEKVGDQRAARLMERRAMAAGLYAYLTRGRFYDTDDYGLLPNGIRSPTWTWDDVKPSSTTTAGRTAP